MTLTRLSRLVALSTVGAIILTSAPAMAQEDGSSDPAISALKDHDTSQPIDIVADRWVVEERDNRATFYGDVTVEQGKMQLLAQQLVVYYRTDNENKDPVIIRLDASGGVEVISDTEKVTGAWGIYDVENRIVTLGGEVQLLSGSSTIDGERLELDLESGISKLDGRITEEGEAGRVKGRFAVPNKNDGR